jgi:TRAP-type C4-dicarboxylate transport system permease small subunit
MESMEETARRPRSLLDALYDGMAWVAAALVVFMMLAIAYSVAMRYLFDLPVPWVVEVSSYLMLYITFLGAAWLLRRDGHVEVDLFLIHAGPRTAAAAKAITSLFGAAVGLVLTWNGALVTVDQFQRAATTFGVLNTPQWLLTGVIPLGGALLLLEFVLRAWKHLRLFARPARPAE